MKRGRRERREKGGGGSYSFVLDFVEVRCMAWAIAKINDRNGKYK